jgi:cardiolipin synthase
MEEKNQQEFTFFDDTFKLFNSMLNDIENAKRYIFLEMYKFSNDTIGERFRDAITKKAKEGVKVRLLLDSWGSTATLPFFTELIKNRGEVRYFKKMKYTFDSFTKHHRRNHRKLLIIDDKISYIGSANLTAYSLSWREGILRINGDLALTLKKSFYNSRRIYNKLVYNKKAHARTYTHGEFKIVCDVPSLKKQRIKKKFENLIKEAKSEIIIETPYFLPGFYLRKCLIDASNRGVIVKIITPLNSDVSVVDILRSQYFGHFYKSNVKFLFYKPYNLHAKIMVIDNETFALGSSNFDYRSFRYMHEIMLIGKDSQVISLLKSHIVKTLESCEPFNYDKWKNRPVFHKILERILIPFRHLL